ncbi:MAG: DEAD/DEAH box helicase, partial [Candidatus Bipolaricaulota bacterium]
MNPFKVLNNVQEGYRRYAESFQNFANESIREWINEQIEEGDLLWKEPYVELVRGFRRGCEFQDLVDDPSIPFHPDTWKSFGREGSERGSEPYPLYKHQEESIRSVLRGNNTIIATGTGSGKTFCFMVPIVSKCLELKEQGTSGIKALIIYPMNALANSQYNEMAARLAGTGLKIALYTGDTEYEEQKAREEFRDRFGRKEPYDSEMISREQIQTTPPDILMTNYQMLEFILTRRDDRKLFPSGSSVLEYLVLDEVHTYSGTQGADVACLMRRLKEHIGVKGSIRCIGTSATIQSEGDSAGAVEDITNFATDLFGESFSEEHVIRESRLPFPERDLEELPERVEVGENDLSQDGTIFEEAVSLAEGLTGKDLSWVTSRKELGEAVYNNPTLAFLERRCESGSVPFDDLIEDYREELRPDYSKEECRRELVAALIIGSEAEEEREGREKERFVPKVHAFFSQGRSVVSCLSEDGPHLSDRGENICRECDEPRQTFPLYFCANCGQEYYAVREENGELKPADPEKDEDIFYLYPDSWDKDQVDIPEGWFKDDDIKGTYEDAIPEEAIYGVSTNELGNSEDPEARDVTLVPYPFQLCLNCGIHYTKRPSEFRKLFTIGSVGRSTGTDVMVSSLLEETPEDERKTIVFSDNRQDTALQSSHMNELRKRLQLRRALNFALDQKEDSEMLLREAGYEVSDVLAEFGVMQDHQKGSGKFGQPGGAEEAWAKYLLYVIIEDLEKDTRRLHQDLEDCGLLQVDFYDLDEFASYQEVWEDIPVLNGVDGEKREDYLTGLLRNMQDYMAINSRLYTDRLYFRRNVLNQLNDKIRFDKGKFRRNPVAYSDVVENSRYAHVKPFATGGLNAYVKWTKEFLDLGTGRAKEVLAEVFKLLQEETEYLSEHDKQSDVWLLNPDAIVLRRVEQDKSIVCADCGRVHWWNTDAPCYRYTCSSGLREADFNDNYFYLEYEKEPDESVAVMAEEHSGQLSGEERQKIEQNFESPEEDLNVIVCTPTMELGID